MEDNLPEGDWETIDIRCPNCDSLRVVVCEDSHGHFQVIKCHNCNYTKECSLDDEE